MSEIESLMSEIEPLFPAIEALFTVGYSMGPHVLVRVASSTKYSFVAVQPLYSAVTT